MTPKSWSAITTKKTTKPSYTISAVQNPHIHWTYMDFSLRPSLNHSSLPSTKPAKMFSSHKCLTCLKPSPLSLSSLNIHHILRNDIVPAPKRSESRAKEFANFPATLSPPANPKAQRSKQPHPALMSISHPSVPRILQRL